MEVPVSAGQYTALSTRLEHYGTKSRIAMRAGRQYGTVLLTKCIR